MRESNFAFPAQNKACVCITAQLYDRRALDTTSPLPLFNSLTHLAYLTSTSPRIREIMTMDGGLERLVRLLHEFCISPPPPENPSLFYGLAPPNARPPKPLPALNPPTFDKHATYRFSLAFQCVVNIGVRGSEPIRSRVVQAGTLEVVGCILEAWLAHKGFAVGPSSSATGVPRETREQRHARRLLRQQQDEAAELARALQRQMNHVETPLTITSDTEQDTSNTQSPSITTTPMNSHPPPASALPPLPTRDRSGTVVARLWDQQYRTNTAASTSTSHNRHIRNETATYPQYANAPPTSSNAYSPSPSPVPSTASSNTSTSARVDTDTDGESGYSSHGYGDADADVDGDADMDMDQSSTSASANASDVDRSDGPSTSASPSPERRPARRSRRVSRPERERRLVGIVADNHQATGGMNTNTMNMNINMEGDNAHIVLTDDMPMPMGIGMEAGVSVGGVEDGIVSMDANDDLAMGAPPGAPGAIMGPGRGLDISLDEASIDMSMSETEREDPAGSQPNPRRSEQRPLGLAERSRSEEAVGSSGSSSAAAIATSMDDSEGSSSMLSPGTGTIRGRRKGEAPDVTPRAAVVGLPSAPSMSASTSSGGRTIVPDALSSSANITPPESSAISRTGTIRGRPATALPEIIEHTSSADGRRIRGDTLVPPSTSPSTDGQGRGLPLASSSGLIGYRVRTAGDEIVRPSAPPPPGNGRTHERRERDRDETVTTTSTSNARGHHHHHRDTQPAPSPYRDEDVLLGLQLLAYLSKYPHVRQAFYKKRESFHPATLFNPDGPSSSSNATASSSKTVGSRSPETLMRTLTNGKAGGKGKEKDGMDGSASTSKAEVDSSSPTRASVKQTNVFSLVERFTFRPSSAETEMYNAATGSTGSPPRLPPEIQYWAGVIMRNACRKDDSRGGIRQCANMLCGRWEEYPREFAKCRRCRKAKYCGKECQSTAWSEGHRFWCSAKDADVDDAATATGSHSHSTRPTGAGAVDVPISIAGDRELTISIPVGTMDRRERRERDRREQHQQHQQPQYQQREREGQGSEVSIQQQRTNLLALMQAQMRPVDPLVRVPAGGATRAQVNAAMQSLMNRTIQNSQRGRGVQADQQVLADPAMYAEYLRTALGPRGAAQNNNDGEGGRRRAETVTGVTVPGSGGQSPTTTNTSRTSGRRIGDLVIPPYVPNQRQVSHSHRYPLRMTGEVGQQSSPTSPSVASVHEPRPPIPGSPSSPVERSRNTPRSQARVARGDSDMDLS